MPSFILIHPSVWPQYTLQTGQTGQDRQASQRSDSIRRTVLQTVGQKRVKLHQIIKFRGDRSNRRRDMAIYRFFKVAAAGILYFQILVFLTVGTIKRAKLRHIAKFCGDRSNDCWDMSIFYFCKMAAYRHLGLWWARLDHPRRAFGDLYHCEQFGWNRCGSFDNMQVLYFAS